MTEIREFLIQMHVSQQGLLFLDCLGFCSITCALSKVFSFDVQSLIHALLSAAKCTSEERYVQKKDMLYLHGASMYGEVRGRIHNHCLLGFSFILEFENFYLVCVCIYITFPNYIKRGCLKHYTRLCLVFLTTCGTQQILDQSVPALVTHFVFLGPPIQ